MGHLAINGGSPVRKVNKSPWPRATDEDVKAVTEAMQADSWCRISGSYANTFEKAFAAFQGAPFGVAVTSGAAALELGLLALGIKPGDEVIMSPYTFMASAASVLVTRGVPIFVDMDPDTYNIDPDHIESAITDRTFAIMPVHFGGRACDMDRILEVAQRRGLKVIEDASHAHGATWNDVGLGTIGDVGAFSCGSGKNLTAGEGGILLTNDEELYWRAAELHDLWTGGLVQRSGEWGGGSFYSDSGWTFPQAAPNYRLSEILAALLSSQLERLGPETNLRFENGVYLSGLLAETTGLRPLQTDRRITRNSCHIYIFKYLSEEFDNLPREDFLKALDAEGIPASKGYPRGCHRHPVFLDAKGRDNWPYNLPLTEVNIDYSSMECANVDRLCESETVWLSGTFMLDAGSEGIEQVVEAAEKIRANLGELR